jgi:Chalcone isomerase-like
MKTLRIVATALMLLHAAGLRAAECLGVTMPDQFELDGKTLLLNGLGARLATMLKVKVYVAGLYLEQRSNDAKVIIDSDQPRHLVLKFIRDVSKSEITDAWTDGFKKNAADYASLADRVATLNAAMTDLANGSTLSFSYVPGRGTNVDIDGTQKATISGADFASALIAIWLGKPPNKEVKVGLLGGDCN